MPEVERSVEPALAGLGVPLDVADQRVLDGLDPDGLQDVALEAIHALCVEIEA